VHHPGEHVLDERVDPRVAGRKRELCQRYEPPMGSRPLSLRANAEASIRLLPGEEGTDPRSLRNRFSRGSGFRRVKRLIENLRQRQIPDRGIF